MKRGVWATLDIAPTTDRSAIRRAYATRLKAMDVDADPDGFAALRDARDAALAHAAEPRPEPVPELQPEPEQPPPPPADPDPEVIALHDAIDAHFRALQALLFPGDDTAPGAEELAAIEHHGRALLADPRLEQVDFATDAERWFAEVLAAAIPRSDPLLEPAAATFGWIDRRDDYALLPDAHAIVERIGATRFVALVADPKHRLHRAWGELNRDDCQRRPLWSSKVRRRELLSLIRTRYPQVESWLEPRRVGETENTTGPFAGIPVWGIVFAIVMVLRLFFSASDEPARPPTVPPAAYLPAPVQDGVLPPPPVEQSRVSTGQVSGLTHAPTELLREIADWEWQVMRHYRPYSPAICADVSLWQQTAELKDLEQQRIALIEQVIGHARDEVPPTPSSRFELRDGIVEAVLRITKFDDARFRRSLDHDAPVEDQCATQIAIRQAALDARPRIGNKLLRQLQLAGFGK